MHGLVITAENLENQRQAVKEERRLRVDNVAYGQTSEKVEELIYDNFAYHHPVVGSMEDLDAASVDDVKQFFKTYYAPNNAVLALVGDLDTTETLAKVKKYFGAIPRQTPPKPVDLGEKPQDGERRAAIAGSAGAPRAGGNRLSHSRRQLARYARARRRGFDSWRRRRWWTRRSRRRRRNSRLYNLLVEEKEMALNVSAGAERRGGPGMFRITATSGLARRRRKWKG